MTTDNQEMFECVIPLPDALIRKPMDEPSKSVKHGDHDQSDHGNWAHGGASDRSAGNVSRYIQAHGLKTTVSKGTVADSKESAMFKIGMAAAKDNTLPSDHRNDTPEMRAARIANEELRKAALIISQGYRSMREAPSDEWRAIELFAPDGTLAAAAMGTLQEQADGGKAFAMRYFGSVGTVEGAGTAIMARSLELAADANAEYRLIKVQDGAHEWYQQWGFDTLDTSGKADMSREQVHNWVTNYRAGTTKSLKHGDHDQSDHGNWADGSGDGSKENPIRTNSVEDAARALGEGKHVELRTPDQVATLLDRLNELAKEAEAAGSKAKNIDLCQLTVPGTNLFCVESKGIPRVEMPQLKGIPNSGSAASDLPADKRGEVDITEAYLERLRSSGVTLTEDEALASHLKATQNELNGGKVAGIMQAARAGEIDLNQSIVVSKDGYIVDGHHRWAAKVALEHDGIDNPETDMKFPVVRVDQDILEILESSKQFAANMGLPQMAVKSLKHGDHDQSDHGNWAHGNAAIPALSATGKKEGEKYLIERYPPEDRNRDSDLGKKLGLTSLEWAAADHYRTQGYMEINNLLRGVGSDWGMEFAPADIRSVQLLDEAMDKSTIKNFETVYRGTSMLASKMENFLFDLKVGGVYTDPSFVSTSRGEDIAESFATDRPPDEALESRASLMWEIVLPPGTSALDMQSLFPNFGSNEEEVLLDRDTHLRILAKESAGVTLDGEPVYRIKAIAIPTATKSLKHADHDQSDHGNWATGGGVLTRNAERFKAAGGTIDKPVKATDSPRSDYATPTGLYGGGSGVRSVIWHWDDLVNKAVAADDARTKADEANMNLWETTKLDIESPEYEKESDKFQKAFEEADRLALGYKLTVDAITSTPFNEVIVARGADGSIVGALAYYMPPDNSQFTVQLLGSTHEVSGTGTALMREAMGIALDKGVPFQVLDPVADAQLWYESLGLGPLQMSDGDVYHASKPLYRVEPDALREILGTTKSLKHADHDQLDHGSWADGSVPLAKTPIEQVDSLRQWSSNSYDQVNKALRDPKILAAQERGGNREMWQKTQDGLDLLFKGVPPTTRPWALYRGATGEFVTDLVKQYDSMIAKGEEEYRATGKPPASFVLPRFTDQGFVSTTPDKNVAMHFTGSGFQGGPFYTGDGRAIFEINYPEGSKMVNVEEYATEFGGFASYAREESEFLLPRGLTFEVTDVTPSDEQFGSQGPVFYTIKLDVVPSSTKSLKHGDHDQSDHGNWATAGADHQYTGEPRSESSRADKSAYEDRYGDMDRRVKGMRAGSESLGREVKYMEIVALESYTGNGYGEINRHLRGYEKGSDWTKDRVDAIKALAAPTTAPMTVTRMMPLFAVDGIAAGQVYEDKGFMSTGKGEGPAQFFFGYPVQMQIELPAGTPVVDSDNFSGLDPWGNIEKEVILMPNSQLVIDRVEQRDWSEDFGPQQSDGLKVYARLVPATKSYKHADHDQSDHGSWADGEPAEGKFNEAENGAITIYTDQGHMDINGYLRTGYLRASNYGGSDDVVRWIENLDAAIESAGPTRRDMTIFRGVSERHLQELIDGGVLKDPGFASFTKDAETASSFARGASQGYRRTDGAVLELDLPAGSAALDMFDAGIPNEQEVLLPRDSRFELISGPEELDLSNEEQDENNTVPVYQIRLVSPAKSYKHADHDQSDHGSWAENRDQIEREDAERAKNDPWKDSPVSRSDAYASMAHYADFGYIPINRFLRGSDGDRPFSTKDKILQDVKNIDAMFTVATPLAEDLKVFRGVSYEQGSEMIAGRIFTDAGYTSTSRNAITPFGFMDETASRQYMMEITVPAGSKVAQVELSNEAETLLPRGSQFRITGLRNDGITIVEATLINSLKSYKHADHDQSDHGSWADRETYTAEARNAAERALTHYSIDGYHRINSYLRKIDSSQDELNTGDFDPEPVIKEIDSLFNSATPLKAPVTVFRGLDSEVAESITWKQGDTYTDAAFMSTSLREEVSERFTGYGGKGTYIMQIEVPAGTTALTPSMFASLVDEDEVVLNRGTTLQITGTELKDNFNYIYASVVPATKSLKHGDHDQSDHGNWATGSSASPEMTKNQYDTVHEYTRNGYRNLNETLREGNREDVEYELESERVKALDALIAANSLTKDTVVYRGVKLNDDQRWDYGGYTSWNYVNSGDILQDEGYMSTAKSYNEAAKFMSFGGHSGQPIMFEITVPAGSPALDVSAAMKDYESKNGSSLFYPYESEILLPRETRLEITDKSEDENGRLVISATVSPLPTKSMKHGDHDQSDHGNWATGSEFKSPSSEDRSRTPKGSTTSTPYAAHYYDTQQRQRLDMALDAYTHWKPENSGDTDADRPFHAVINDNLRNGMNRGKAVEAASAEFATGDEKDDEATASDLYEGFMSLDSATQNSRMMEDTVVTRASSPIIYLDELEAAAAGGSLELYGFDISQGAVFSDAGFVSTSLDTTGQSTQYFANRWDTEGLDDNQIPTSVRWNITVPEGAPALDLRALEFGSQHGEQEVILPRNTHFQVDSWDVQLPKFEGRPASVTINATVIPTHAKP